MSSLSVPMRCFLIVILIGWTAAFVCGLRCYIVTSGSMEPAIPVGSVCLVDTSVKYGEIQPGDVIAFRRGNGLVTHRVVAVTADGLETKGDANERSDGITTGPDNFHGKTIGYLPGMGYGLLFCKRFLLQWSIPILLGAWLLQVFRERKGGSCESN